MTVTDAEVEGLLDRLMTLYGHDFRRYARASLDRRVDRALLSLRVPSVEGLVGALDEDPSLVPRLVDLLTVQVSEMFRDPPFYRAMRDRVLPVLATWPSVKVWVAGCSTGEEAWSIAVLLDEAGLLDRSLLYATDISESALAIAERGVYSLDRLAAFARNHRESGGTRALTESFHTAYGHAVVDRRLQDRVVFAEHSLATDHVFSEVHVVTCRNVLIYFDPALQDRAVGLFHEALVHGGFLGLGSKESLRGSQHAARFEPIDAPQRLFRRR